MSKSIVTSARTLCAQVTVPVTVTATSREDVLEFLGRLSEYENGAEAD